MRRLSLSVLGGMDGEGGVGLTTACGCVRACVSARAEGRVSERV